MKAALMVMGVSAFGVAAAPPTEIPPRPAGLAGELAPLSYYLGDWTIEATWAWGMTLEGRNEYRVGVGGRFLEVITVASDNGGEPYERYHSFYTPQKEGDAYVATGFTYDGTTSSIPYTFEVEDGLPTIRTDVVNPDGSRLRQEIDPVDANNAAWRVWMTPPGSDQEQQVMDGVWTRAEEGDDVGAANTPADPWESAAATMQPGPHDIAAGLFATGGADLRSFVRAAEIDAPPARVFEAWTDRAAWKRAFGPDRAELAANMDLAIGGRYEWLFDGRTGGNGCQVLSYIPDRMLSFSWNAPPGQPETRRQRTWVVVEFEPIESSRTRVTLTHLGFGDGPAWDETRGYFETAWGRVLETFAGGLAEG
ncbi:MAG: SRPBCC domain-containing protein [Phycisphaerales bacterium]